MTNSLKIIIILQIAEKPVVTRINFERLDSPLVNHSWLGEDMSWNAWRAGEFGLLVWGKVLYIGDPDMIMAALGRCLATKCLKHAWQVKGRPILARSILVEGFIRFTQRVAMAAFWRSTFHHDGKISPGCEGGGCTPLPFSLNLPSRTKLQCTL